MSVKCDYCGNDAEKVTGADVYPHRPDLSEKIIYRCTPCEAHVGCHPGSDKPLGRIANKTLRKAKMEAHAAFDPLWRGRKMSRGMAYAWLAQSLNMRPDDCHIGMMDVADCKRVVAAVNAKMAEPCQ